MKTQTNFNYKTLIPGLVIAIIIVLASCAPRYGCYYGITSDPVYSQDQVEVSDSDVYTEVETVECR